jgi:hypothetical protein
MVADTRPNTLSGAAPVQVGCCWQLFLNIQKTARLPQRAASLKCQACNNPEVWLDATLTHHASRSAAVHEM